ncbi:MAG: beta-N-acetylglucosaminidase [Candidatus Lokiarchaeota archaeon]|nr:beta-N-acetylglucosaminidase [Candidatus Lokiarchaeota archaeon]
MQDNKISIIPKPVNLTFREGNFILTEQTTIESEKGLKDTAEYFKNLISTATGFNLAMSDLTSGLNKSNTISLELTEKLDNLGEEGYCLKINQNRIILTAHKSAGIFHGIQTIRQLLPIEVEKKAKLSSFEWVIPALEIEDYPRFSWRGFMLDEGRHFFGKNVVKHILDLMAYFKMNVFHWHLTEDQGWRIEIKKYPKLTEVGSKRKESQIGGFLSKNTDGTPHEGYYTQEEIKEIISYADKLFIKIVPEIDIPGHSMAALAAYPEFSCTGGPFEVSTTFSVKQDVFCVGKEATFKFLNNVLDEIVGLFPSDIIHIGGDEVPKKRWETCPDCQERIEKEGLKNEKGLQAYFTDRIMKSLSSHGRRIMGWNQILTESSNKEIIAQKWLFGKNLIKNHLTKGGNVVFSQFGYTYLDYSYALTSLSKTYWYEPIPKSLLKNYHINILGIEAPMWTEWVRNVKELDWQTFPRLIVFAESNWTPREQKNFKSFKNRLESILKRLDIIGVQYAHKKEYQPSIVKRIFGFFTIFREPKRSSLHSRWKAF